MKGFVGWLGGRGAPELRADPAPEVYDRCSVLFRGYIANTPALIEESKKRGDVLRDGSDAELFAKAYQWWGEGLQSRVIGEYAVAVFDERRSSLLLTHDSLGIAPLFYSQSPDGLIFSSHLEGLVLKTGAGRLDEEYIADYLATCSVISARTPYVGIFRLQPGQSLCWIDRKISVRRTWDVRNIEPIDFDRDEEFEERFRALLREGIAAALRSDGKVWGELSGGLDSSSVVSMAAHSEASQLEVISIVYTSSKTADESEWIDAVLRKYPLPRHTLDGDEARPFTELPRGFCAEPLGALPGAGLFRLYGTLAESHGVSVVLSGIGGDQIFCGDSPNPCYLADYLPFQLRRLFAALRDWQASNADKRSLLYFFRKSVLRPFLGHLAHRSLNSPDAAAVPPWIHPRYLRAMRLKGRAADQLAPQCRSIWQQYLAERIWRVGLSASDQGTKSFEFRYPLLYRPLVEFMLAIPWQQVLQPGRDRHLQRRALKGILPEPVRQRRDKGGPAEAEIKGLRNGSAWTDLLLTRPLTVERGYLDARLWHEAVNQARFGRIASMRHFVATATLEVWLRQLEDVRRAPTTFEPESLSMHQSRAMVVTHDR